MSDSTEQPGGGPAPKDPWAPPDSRVELGKPAAAGPPPVHDQPTVSAMPGLGTGPVPGAAGPGFGPGDTAAGFGPGDASVPPPPIAPNGPGQAAPPAGQYGYPAAPVPPYGGYPGSYPGYGGQSAWGGPQPANGLGTAAMVLGILAVCLFCVYGIPSLILGVLALIFGILGRKRVQRGEASNNGQALAGVILGSIGIALGAAIIGFFIWLFATHSEEFSDVNEYEDPYATSLVVDAGR
ncbi:DUF4190 domain-containing protein [Streptomyces sp. NBC_00234]|uniref:DUF4190 domain-containing protein n=1 Tax=Streptomyces sp. NBC_00234 TaxID=2903638 RepID=UPI002E27E043|nr:DUF4190 domain-containing protein [Streptomyces sp. NBC_00234]